MSGRPAQVWRFGCALDPIPEIRCPGGLGGPDGTECGASNGPVALGGGGGRRLGPGGPRLEPEHPRGVRARRVARAPSRACSLAMVHGAIYDAVVSIAGGYQPYLGKLDADPTASKVAAAATAAHDVLAAMYPDQAADLQALLDTSLGAVADGPAKDAGIAVGKAAAAQMLAAREGDGRGGKHPLTYGDGPGEYRPTPPDMTEFGAAWLADVKPFLAESADYYRTEGPYALDSAEYAADFNEVKTLGALEGSTRTPEQDALVAFWVSPFGQWSAAERVARDREGPRHRRGRPAVRDLGPRRRRRAHRRLERQVPLDVLAPRDGHPRGGRPTATTRPRRTPTGCRSSTASSRPTRRLTPTSRPAGTRTPAPSSGAMQEYFGTDEMAYKIGSPNVDDTPQLHLVHARDSRTASSCGSSRASTSGTRTSRRSRSARRPRPSPRSDSRPRSSTNHVSLLLARMGPLGWPHPCVRLLGARSDPVGYTMPRPSTPPRQRVNLTATRTPNAAVTRTAAAATDASRLDWNSE